MTKDKINELKNINIDNIENAIASAIISSGYTQDEIFERSVDIAYLLYLAIENELDINDISNIIKYVTDEDLRATITVFDKPIWDRFVSNFKMKYSVDEYLAYVLFAKNKGKYSAETSTPESIVALANRILAVKDGESVADICSGFADYLTYVSSEAENLSLYGIEINKTALSISRVRLNIIGADCVIEERDAFDTIGDDKTFNKVFSNFPFAMRDMNQLDSLTYLFDKLDIDYEGKQRLISTDWVFTLLAASKIKEDGKAVVILPNGTASNTIEKDVRQKVIESGLIETVIELPSKLFATTNISTFMLVLSKNNDRINFVNATELYNSGRRMNEITSDLIDVIINSIGTESNISSVKTIEEVIENKCSLVSSKYLETVEVENGVPFGSLIKNITRGAQLKANELDALNSQNPTPYQYLTIANVKYGLIDLDTDPQYITEIADNLKKYCVKNGSLIISKIASPELKVAVAEVKEDTTILANGNLYVVELNDDVEPYYIQAFFDSQLGKAVVAPKLNGNTFQMITVSGINELMIPMPQKVEKQKEIANKYKETLDKIVSIKAELNKTTNSLSSIFEL